MATEENKAIIRRWIDEAYNQGNVTSADRIYAANYVLHDPSGTVQGPEGLNKIPWVCCNSSV